MSAALEVLAGAYGQALNKPQEQQSSSPMRWPSFEASGESALFASRDSENACGFVPNPPGTREDRRLHYFLPCDLNAWLTHEVTIVRTFVPSFCACPPAPSEKEPR
jgi:hypothetical protein